MNGTGELRNSEVCDAPRTTHSTFREEYGTDLPPVLIRFLRSGDRLALLSMGNTEVLVERWTPRGRPRYLLHATIGHMPRPKESEKCAGFFVRTELPKCSTDPTALLLSGDAIRRYFYLLDDGQRTPNLYSLLQAPESAACADLRVAWRVRLLEFSLRPAKATERTRAERAFNVLAHPDLRTCYDLLRTRKDAPPLFPYGGFGSILVEGQISNDGKTFFADRILGYKPEMSSRCVSLLLRQCEFFADRVICRDPRRKLEVWLDSCLLPGIHWDLTWNHWKHWLRSRVDVEATFVRTGEYLPRKSEWVLRTWHTALPSRLRLTPPENIAADIERAKAIHTLLGENAAVVERIRAELQQQPVEHVRILDWFDRLGTSSHLQPQHVTWRPDYEPYYFEQLLRRSTTWFLFRDEYLFVWASVLIAEIPQLGHATYVFTKPEVVCAFMRRYSSVTRDDIRRNRDNVATDLGFVGRIIRGRKRKRWLDDVLTLAGEKADYVEEFE